MSVYPSTEFERKIDHGKLHEIVSKVFLECGMCSSDAVLLSQFLVRADLRGCHSHGIIRVPDYVKKLVKEGVNPKGKPFIVKENQAAIVVDADNNMGQIACHYAMQLAIERARNFGLAMACVQGSNHCGALADFAMMASDAGMIGIAGTNALPTMAPFGGVDKILGINPLAVAIPAGEEDDIVFDAAFSASSHGKIRVYHQKGAVLPDGWAFNERGEPTTNTAEAIEGLLQPIGGYKGTGLALLVGLLSTMLTQASYGTQLGNMVDGPKPGKDGHFCIAINVSSFIELDTFRSKVDKVIEEIKQSALAPGVAQIYPPGGLEAYLEAKALQEGIPLNEVVLKDLAKVAHTLGIDLDIADLEFLQAS